MLIKWKSDSWTCATGHVGRGRINERQTHQGKVVTARPPERLVAQQRSSLMSDPLLAEQAPNQGGEAPLRRFFVPPGKMC